MYVICTYDVEEKRCAKVMKLLRQYLFHSQRSVFEGTLTPKQFQELKEELATITLKQDSVIFFYSYNEKQIYKSELGKEVKVPNILIH